MRTTRPEKLGRKNCLLPLLVCCALSVCLSCKTMPRFKGEGDLCGLVVDENNEPVKDFLIYCKNEFEITNTAMTNETGMFVVHNVPSGVYKISGKKKDFVKLEATPFYYTDRDRIFCCQVSSIDAAFITVEQLMQRGEKKKAAELLENLYCEKKSPEQAVILVYKFFLSEKKREKKRYVSEIRKLGKIGMVDYSKFADSLEELINEEKK